MADRNYSLSFNQNKAAPAFQYVEDLSLSSGSGAWRPLRNTDFGGGSTIINVSGIDQLIIDTDELEGLARTGNALIASGNSLINSGNSLLSSGNTYLSSTVSLLTTANALYASGNAYAAPASVTNSLIFTGSLLAKSSAGEIHSVFGYCSGNAQYLRMYDGTGTNGTLLSVIAVDAQNNFSADFSSHGAKVTNGIFVAFSSSPSSHVATGPDGIITIIWK